MRNRTAMVLVMISVILPMSSCGKPEETQVEEVVRPVKTMVLESMESGWERTYPGKTEATDTANLAFQHAGKVIELPATRGMRVSKGQLLVKIDSRDFEADAVKVKAALAEAKADLDRYRKLYENDAISLADLQVREVKHESAFSNLKVAEKAVEDTELRAPYDGVVSKILIDNFQNVNPGEVALRVQDISQIEISIYIPERDITIAPKSESISATAELDAFPGREFKIELKEWETEADETTQTFRIKFIMPQTSEGARIMPGMSASVKIMIEGVGVSQGHLFVIPSGAVFPDVNGDPHVWVVNSETLTAHKRLVRVGQVRGTDEINVLEGLQPGEMIAIAAIRHLREGMKVRVMKGDITG